MYPYEAPEVLISDNGVLAAPGALSPWLFLQKESPETFLAMRKMHKDHYAISSILGRISAEGRVEHQKVNQTAP